MLEVLDQPSVRDTAAWLDIYQSNCSLLFFTALLITGAVKSAEAAVGDSVDLVDGETVASQRAIMKAVAVAAGTRTSSFDQNARSLLPEELQAVADLRLDLRICFVLRRLIGLTAREAAELMGMRPFEIDCCASRASIHLAQRSSYVA